MEYDLEARTKTFSKNILRFFKTTKINIINENIIKQVLRSSSSIGANYCEANGAISKSDFRSKVYICKKEAKETVYWLNLLEETVGDSDRLLLQQLESEAKQLMLIFSKISTSLKI